MNIFIASDHAGLELKKFLMESLTDIGHTVVDYGAYVYNELDDYPPYISRVAKAVSESESVKATIDDSGHVPEPQFDAAKGRAADSPEVRGIVIGGSGQGEAIVANKFRHVRAALCYGGERAEEIVRLSREHNNSNVLSLGARFLAEDQAIELTLLWLNTPFSGDERHVRRLHEVDQIEADKNATLYE